MAFSAQQAKVLYVAALGVAPAAVYLARRSDGNDARATWLAAAVVVLAIARQSSLSLRNLFPGDDAHLLADSRADDPDGDLPDLVRLAGLDWEEDCPPAFAKDDPRHGAYVWCRHDLDICTRQAPPERVWDDALGAVPSVCAARWRAQVAAAHKRASRGSPPPTDKTPPPRQPRRTALRFSSSPADQRHSSSSSAAA